MEMSKRMGAHVVLDPKECDVVAEIKKLTGGGADVAIEALGLQVTFENALRCLRPGGTLSSLGVYSGKLQVPYDAFAAGLGDYKIVTTLCPGGKERMRRLMSMVQSKRFDPLPLITHKFKLDQIVEAYDVFGVAPRRLLESGYHALTSGNHPDKKCNFGKRTKVADESLVHQMVPNIDSISLNPESGVEHHACDLADGKVAAKVKCRNEHERSSATHTCAPHLARLV